MKLNISDAEQPRRVKQNTWSPAIRPIKSGDIFSQYVASPAESSFVIVDGLDQHVHCKFNDIVDPETVVYSSFRKN